jgi:hypothetical protein
VSELSAMFWEMQVGALAFSFCPSEQWVPANVSAFDFT